METDLDKSLRNELLDGAVSLVILCGNAGDGKTSVLQHLASLFGLTHARSAERVWEVTLDNQLLVRANLDGAASWGDKSADDLLDEAFDPFLEGPPDRPIAQLVAVNDGRLLEWIEGHEARKGSTLLTRQLAESLSSGSALDSHVRLVELNERSLVGGLSTGTTTFSTQFIDSLLERLVGGSRAKEIWRPCTTCTAQERCVAWHSARRLGAEDDPDLQAQGRLLRERLTTALQTVHQRNEIHITARELKGALSYILFGVRYCAELHASPEEPASQCQDLAFDPQSPARQGELLREMTRLDPALESHPRVDRYLMARGQPDPLHGAPRYPDLTLASARRRAYLEWTDVQIQGVGQGLEALGLARGRHSRKFRDFPVMNAADQRTVLEDVCRGIARLEDLPQLAHARRDVVPLRIIARTPAETTFWVEKSLDRFTLSAETFPGQSRLETMHRQLALTYSSAAGWRESLGVPLELFCLLMELGEGTQIADAFSDDVFANLETFIQRLAQEDERCLRAWNPVDEQRTFGVGVEVRDGHQVLVVSPQLS